MKRLISTSRCHIAIAAALAISEAAPGTTAPPAFQKKSCTKNFTGKNTDAINVAANIIDANYIYDAQALDDKTGAPLDGKKLTHTGIHVAFGENGEPIGTFVRRKDDQLERTTRVGNESSHRTQQRVDLGTKTLANAGANLVNLHARRAAGIDLESANTFAAISAHQTRTAAS